MNLETGYSIETVKKNIGSLSGAVDTPVAIMLATSFARGVFKKEHPGSLKFPEHIKPGGSMKYFEEELNDG